MRLLLLLILLSITGFAYAQRFELPVFSSKSHKTLQIDEIYITADHTEISLSVTSELAEGEAWFCADKNIYIQNPEGDRKFKILRSEGIPVCPEAHKFSGVGEVLRFKLFFPTIPNEITSIDLIENCFDNCFYFKGIVLDEQLNTEIKTFEQGVALFRNEQKEAALPVFLEIVNNSKYTKERHFAYSMYIIPVIYHEQGNQKEAKLWYEKLKNSNISNKYYFVATIKEIEFFGKLD